MSRPGTDLEGRGRGRPAADRRRANGRPFVSKHSSGHLPGAPMGCHDWTVRMMGPRGVLRVWVCNHAWGQLPSRPPLPGEAVTTSAAGPMALEAKRRCLPGRRPLARRAAILTAMAPAGGGGRRQGPLPPPKAIKLTPLQLPQGFPGRRIAGGPRIPGGGALWNAVCRFQVTGSKK